jgi:hypothetical protein
MLFLSLVAAATTAVAEEGASFSSYWLALQPSETTPTQGVSTNAQPSAADLSAQFQNELRSEKQARMDVICRRLERMDADGYLFHPAEVSDSPVVNAVNAVFEPEVIHIGKISASFSLYTAIKRKNPLCLLNPAVLDFGW